MQFTTPRFRSIILKTASGVGFGFAFGVSIGVAVGLVLGAITTLIFAPYFDRYYREGDAHAGYHIFFAPIAMGIFLTISGAIIGSILGIINSFTQNKTFVTRLALLIGLLLPAFSPGALRGEVFDIIGYLYLGINTVCACLAINHATSYVVRG